MSPPSASPPTPSSTVRAHAISLPSSSLLLLLLDGIRPIGKLGIESLEDHSVRLLDLCALAVHADLYLSSCSGTMSASRSAPIPASGLLAFLLLARILPRPHFLLQATEHPNGKVGSSTRRPR